MQKNTYPLKIISKIIKVDLIKGWGVGGNQAEPIPRVLLVEYLSITPGSDAVLFIG